MARRSLFEMWLSAQLEICDFGGLTVGEVVSRAAEDLALDEEEVFRLVIRATRAGMRFRANEGMITFRG